MNNSCSLSGSGFVATLIFFSWLPGIPAMGQSIRNPETPGRHFSYPSELQAYVNPTDLCDAENPAIREKALELAGNSKSPREAAIRIFYFVRDSCLFGLSAADEKASETLKSRVGWCITKTNLEVALLRSLGIPARYHQVCVSKSSLKGITSNILYKMVPEPIEIHPWCECNLDGKWIACEVTFDKATYLAGQALGTFKPGDPGKIDWDGTNDCNWVSDFMLKDLGTHVSYDSTSKQVADENRKAGPAFLLRWITNQSNRKTVRLRLKTATGGTIG